MRYGKSKKKILAKNGFFDEKVAFWAKNGKIFDFCDFFKNAQNFFLINQFSHTQKHCI